MNGMGIRFYMNSFRLLNKFHESFQSKFYEHFYVGVGIWRYVGAVCVTYINVTSTVKKQSDFQLNT